MDSRSVVSLFENGSELKMKIRLFFGARLARVNPANPIF